MGIIFGDGFAHFGIYHGMMGMGYLGDEYDIYERQLISTSLAGNVALVVIDE